MNKNNKFLMWSFFILSSIFIGLLLILFGCYVSDYIGLINNDTLSGIDYLMFNFFYVIDFLPVSVLGLITSIICTKFVTSKKIKVILYIESVICILGIVFSCILFFHKRDM